MRYVLRSIVALSTVLAAAVASAAPAQARRVALVIGNSAYEHTRVLPNARSDARLIAELLRKIGLTVTEASDLAYRPMREAIRAFGQTAQGAEMAIVYYAGHGLEVAGENWLLPVSAAFTHERDLEYEAVSLSSILAAVKDATKLRLVMLDACRNNPLGERITLSSGATRSVLRGLARVEPSGDILVAYSAKHGTLAEDGPAGGNSPFATALALNMGTPGLDIRIVLGKVRDAVKAATGGRQEPFTYGSVGGETIALLPGGGPSIAPVLPRPIIAPTPKADLAIGVIPETKPPVMPSYKAPTEPVPADIPLSAELLKLTEVHPFFANAPPVRARSYAMSWSSAYGGATTHYGSKSNITWLRRGLIRVDRVTQETTISGGKRHPQQRREAEIVAANGFLLIGHKSVVSGASGSGSDAQELTAIENMKGRVFPVGVGNRYSYEAMYHQKGYGKRVAKESCEVIEKMDAKNIEPKLTGFAFIQICDREWYYPGRSERYKGKLKSVFLEDFGIWTDSSEAKVTLKSVE